MDPTLFKYPLPESYPVESETWSISLARMESNSAPANIYALVNIYMVLEPAC